MVGGITLLEDEPGGPGDAEEAPAPATVPPPPPPAAKEAAAGEPDGGMETDPRRIRLVFVGLMLTLLLAALDQMIVATALPKIVGELHGLEKMSWAVTAYLLASTIGLPVYGKLGDLFGRKGVFQFAIVVFVVGSALAGWSRTMDQLIAFRALQGVGGGGLMIGVQAIIADVVPPASAAGSWDSSAPPSASPRWPGRCSAASSPTTPPGAGASTSTCRSAWSPSP